MRISCAITANDLSADSSDIIVFPEGTSREVIHETSSLHQNAMIVGAIEEDGFSRGVLCHRGKQLIEYLKVTSDGRTKGSGNLQQSPVFESGRACIGVLVCMDVDKIEFSRCVIEKLRQSAAEIKILCVPANMGSQWFSNQELPPQYHGVYVALCNNNTYQIRCKSFVADPYGRKLVEQREHEAIYVDAS